MNTDTNEKKEKNCLTESLFESLEKVKEKEVVRKSNGKVRYPWKDMDGYYHP